MSKIVNCSYTNCLYPDKKILSKADAVQVGSRYRHKKCDIIMTNCTKIRETYLNNVSSTAVVKALNTQIYNIVFKKLKYPKLSPPDAAVEASEYLLFALNYAINNKMRIADPLSLHYLIDNERIKEAWQEHKSIKIEKEFRNNKIDFSDAKITEYRPIKAHNNPLSFENIFKK